MKKVLTVGVFDCFHYGHLKLFEQAKNIFPDTYLIVAVQEDNFIRKYKPDAVVFYSTDVRKELIKALRCVDEVVSYCDVSEIVKTLDFDVFAIGADQNHQGFQNAIKYCYGTNKEVVRLQRTPNISSSSLKNFLFTEIR